MGALRLLEQYPGKCLEVELAYQLMIVIGFASAIHHASTPKWTIVIDWIPIVLCMMYIVATQTWSLVTMPVLFQMALAIAVLVTDHTTCLIPVPWGHVMWHLQACFAIDCFWQNVEKGHLST